ncbi:transducin beta-like protein 2 isoform X2 [Carcharodon carcharias]|uniref:transducin beta-like protein 2 isoform X2 n=1 Tax=Carcharodon carcharias TaxID=13397 RepID=UPI001B7F15F1|nr:transducin beta-like protein 2 isoform X2 [Carcharodon carcharias]
MEPFAVLAVSLLLGALIFFISAAVTGSRRAAPQEDNSNEEDSKDSNGVSDRNTGSRKQKLQRPRKEKSQQHVFAHPLLATSLKNHSGNISCLDFSSNGKYLASCADDRTVRIWSTKDFLEHDHRCVRTNVELDHATHVCFSPDSRAFITWLANEETIRVFKMIKKDDGSFAFTAAPEDFPKKHKAPIMNIGIAETGKFIMSASNDTTILIWDLKGEVLATINTNQMNNAYATVSPCGRMATVSKDGTWKLWDTDVEYKQQQDPYLLYTMKCNVSDPCRIALSPDARVVAISSGFNITVHSAKTGKQEEEFLNVHGEEIADLAFDINSRFLVSCGDRAIRVFHNVVGYRAVIEEMESRLKKATNEAMRERLQQQIDDAQGALEAVCIKKE